MLGLLGLRTAAVIPNSRAMAQANLLHSSVGGDRPRLCADSQIPDGIGCRTSYLCIHAREWSMDWFALWGYEWCLGIGCQGIMILANKIYVALRMAARPYEAG
jgi:hypothetical protein